MKTIIDNFEKRIALAEDRARKNFDFLKKTLQKYELKFSLYEDTNIILADGTTHRITSIEYESERNLFVMAYEGGEVLIDNSVKYADMVLQLMRWVVSGLNLAESIVLKVTEKKKYDKQS